MWIRAMAIGGGSALVTGVGVFWLRRLDPAIMYALMLAAISFIYVGFAVADGRRRVLVLESAVALAFFWLATFAITVWAPLAAIGLVAHGLWDMVHHPRGVSTRLPHWYPPACAVYDWVLAAVFLVCWGRFGA
jgi:hypothetical protein